MCSKPVLEVNGVSKRYDIYPQPVDRLKQMLWRGRKQFYQEFWALKDISFSLTSGQTLGVIGANGSGKSTLLQLVVGVLAPTQGSVFQQGRIGSLLELGSGFNPEFSGEENIRLNASLLGLSNQEIENKFHQIVEFADIGEFIKRPVKLYSSGMYVRLAFAVMVHLDADILVIDEALAVGDALFVQKCMRFLRDFKKRGAMLFVSHDISAVTSLCDQVLWLNRGEVEMLGEPKLVTDSYLAYTFENQQGKSESARKSLNCKGEDNGSTLKRNYSTTKKDQRLNYINYSPYRNDIQLFDFDPDADSFGKAGITIVDTILLDQSKHPLAWVVGGEEVQLIIQAQANQPIEGAIFGFYLKDKLGQNLFGDTTAITTYEPLIRADEGQVIEAKFKFVMPLLAPGDYSICVAVAEGTLAQHVQHHWVYDAIILKVHSSSVRFGLVGIPMEEVQVEVY